MNKVSILNIYCYPIKSFPGIELTSSYITRKGVKDDRRWMIVDNNNTFITQRHVPELTQFKLEIEGEGYRISHPSNSESFYFSATENQMSDEEVVCSIWKSKVRSMPVYLEMSSWLSQILGQEVRLVQFAADEKRNVNGHKHAEIYYADGHPILVVGSASIEDLNSKIDHSVSQLNFRPNLLVETQKPFEEDSFENLHSDTIQLKNTKLCSRCKIVTLDPDTAVFYPDTMNVLAGYRMLDKGVKFGNYFKILKQGEVAVGDEMSF